MPTNGYFYAAPDLATLQTISPTLFVTDDISGVASAVSPMMIYGTNGIWLVHPVMSEADPETGDQTVLEDGVRSDPLVVLSKVAVAGWEAYAISPVGVQGYA